MFRMFFCGLNLEHVNIEIDPRFTVLTEHAARSTNLEIVEVKST